jgi:monoamine oxidase
MAVELQDRSTGEPSHVIIVGAGLAGLCTAFELESKGLSCTILEADPTHVGGRVRTHRFANGLYGEPISTSSCAVTPKSSD